MKENLERLALKCLSKSVKCKTETEIPPNLSVSQGEDQRTQCLVKNKIEWGISLN